MSTATGKSHPVSRRVEDPAPPPEPEQHVRNPLRRVPAPDHGRTFASTIIAAVGPLGVGDPAELHLDGQTGTARERHLFERATHPPASITASPNTFPPGL